MRSWQLHSKFSAFSMLPVSRNKKAAISQRHQLLWKLKQKVNKGGWVRTLFQFKGCLWTNLPAIYWAPPAGKWLCISKSPSCKKFKFCEWKKGFKMFLTNLLAWRRRYQRLYDYKGKLMSMLLILLISEYLDKKNLIHRSILWNSMIHTKKWVRIYVRPYSPADSRRECSPD